MASFRGRYAHDSSSPSQQRSYPRRSPLRPWREDEEEEEERSALPDLSPLSSSDEVDERSCDEQTLRDARNFTSRVRPLGEREKWVCCTIKA